MGHEKICLEEKKKGRQGQCQCSLRASQTSRAKVMRSQEEEKKPEEPPMLHFAYKLATQLAVVTACK